MRICFSLVALCCCLTTAAAQPAVEGYRDARTLAKSCEALAASKWVTKRVLAKTAQDREVIALTIGGKNQAQRPAVLVVGGVQANSLVGGRLALGIAEELAARAATDESFAAMLEEVTFYVIPRASPDASERFFQPPFWGSATNYRPTDDDRDGRIDEDPPADVNGDGWITQMRVADPTGEWIPHPQDDRVMIKADASKGEQGRYRLLTEDGADDDLDGKFAEDAAGGVDFNRNFTFKYPYFKPGAGPHQVSEPESRAVADFAFDHPNIFLVLCFAPQANLLEDWKTGGDATGVVKTVAKVDAPYFQAMANAYRDQFKPKGYPKSVEHDGSFAAWAYFHYGRWSLATRGWWPPEEQKTADKKQEQEVEQNPSEQDPNEKNPSEKDPNQKDKPSAKEDRPKAKKKEKEKRGKDDLQALAWLEKESLDGFVPWTKWEGPQPSGLHGEVEIGGFKSFVRSHPPVEQVDRLVAPQVDYLLEMVAGRAKIVLDRHQFEGRGQLGEQTVRVVNRGRLPTMTRIGERSRKIPRLEVAIEASDRRQLLAVSRRRAIGRLEAGKGKEITWLWRSRDEPTAAELQIGFAFERDDQGQLPKVRSEAANQAEQEQP